MTRPHEFNLTKTETMYIILALHAVTRHAPGNLDAPTLEGMDALMVKLAAPLKLEPSVRETLEGNGVKL